MRPRSGRFCRFRPGCGEERPPATRSLFLRSDRQLFSLGRHRRPLHMGDAQMCAAFDFSGLGGPPHQRRPRSETSVTTCASCGSSARSRRTVSVRSSRASVPSRRPAPELNPPTFCSALRRARGSGDRVCRPAQATPLGHRKDRRGCRDQSARTGASSDVARRQEGDEAFGLRSRTPASSALTGCPVWLWVRAGTKSALPGSRRERTHPSPWRWRA